jgi:hypothetical protein
MKIHTVALLALVFVSVLGMYEHEKGRNDWK